MRISCNWLRELIEIPPQVDAVEIARLLTMAGLEVEASEDFPDDPGKSDTILTLSITPNRPDALSHYGVARELSALLKLSFSPPLPVAPTISAGKLGAELPVGDLCPRYSCALLTKVKVGPSPAWLQTRLVMLGLKPINNVVDVTNYVMFEMGQPLHAFDWGSLKLSENKISVRLAHAGEILLTLDSVARTLGPNDLVIADASGPVALAGVMGGKDSEVNALSEIILLESAYFDPTIVRRTSKAHGLSTDASYRFERGADPNGVVRALERAVELLCQIAGAELSDFNDCYPKKIAALRVTVSSEQVARVSGIAEELVSSHRISEILQALGLNKIDQEDGVLLFEIPTFRPDITRSIDLVEEVLRIVGYDLIPDKATAAVAQGMSDDFSAEIVAKVRQTLMYGGFREAINLAFGAPEKIGAIMPYADQCITIKNPLGADTSVMRQSLLPRLLENVGLNIRQNVADIRLFELGTIFVPQDHHHADYYGQESAHNESFADERLQVAAVLSGRSNFGAADFYAIKGALNQLLAQLGCATDGPAGDVELNANPEKCGFLHPRSAVFVRATSKSGAIIEGFMGELHPDLMATFGLTQPVMLLELNLSDSVAQGSGKTMFRPIAKFPGIQRDIALVMDEALLAGDLMSFIAKQPEMAPFLKKISVFDVYRGAGLPAGKKSVAFSLFFQDSQRTMTDDEIAALMENTLQALAKKFAATIR